MVRNRTGFSLIELILLVVAGIFVYGKISGKNLLGGWFGFGTNESGTLYSGPNDGSSVGSWYDPNPDADALFNAMADLGTEFDAIRNVFMDRTGAELIAIYNAFGNRRYWLTGQSAIMGEPINLHQWLRNELDAEQLGFVQQQWNQKVKTQFA